MNRSPTNRQRRSFLLVTGPYSAPTEEEVKSNTQRAVDIGRIVLQKGYYPIVPHLLGREYYDPEDDPGIRQGKVRKRAWDFISSAVIRSSI